MSAVKKRLSALVLLAFTGCRYFDLGEPIELDEGRETQLEAGVLTVIGAEDGVDYEAEVYEYAKFVHAAEFNGIISNAKLVGVGEGTADNRTLKISLQTPEGEDFTSDGKFLVVLKEPENASEPVKCMASVPFTGGSATLKYSTMIIATGDPNDPDVSSYIVIFDLNYAGALNPPKPQKTDAGGKVTQPADPTRDGHTFDGWYKEASGTTEWDFDKDTVTTDLDLYAKWTRNTYKVTFDTDDAEHTPAPLENVPYDDKIADPGVTKTGYTLDGWYKEAAKTTKWDFALNTVIENITLYGTWTLNIYTVTFYLNYTGAPEPATQSVAHNGNATLPAIPTRTDKYIFDGWYTDASGSTEYDFDSPVTADLPLYAKWIAPHTVTFYLNYGSNAEHDTQTVAHNGNATLPANPTRAGNYIFGDWYTETNGGEKYVFSTLVTGDLQLYARWLLPSFAVLLTEMANDAGAAAKAYYLASDSENYTIPSPTLTPGNCPATVTIDGGGRVITGDGTDNSIVVRDGITLTVTNLSLHELKLAIDDEGTLKLGEGFFMSGFGGGSRISVLHGGELVMRAGAHITQGNYGSVVLGTWGSNTASAPPKFTMLGGKISGATAQGGVYMLAANSVFTMTGGEISGNSDVHMGGGGVKMAGAGSKFYMSGGTISNNYANLTTGTGGGVAIIGAGSEFHMSGGTITGNSAHNGGGVDALSNTVFEMTGGEITGNTAAGGAGGGVALEHANTLDADGKIKGDPQIGGNNPGPDRGWIHGNSGGDVLWPQD